MKLLSFYQKKACQNFKNLYNTQHQECVYRLKNNLGTWRNWQTHWIQVPAPRGVRVRVSPSPPNLKEPVTFIIGFFIIQIWAYSSVGQSRGLIILWSQVQVLLGLPFSIHKKGFVSLQALFYTQYLITITTHILSLDKSVS